MDWSLDDWSLTDWSLMESSGASGIPSGGVGRQGNSSPWLSFKDDGPQRTRRQLDDEEVLLLVCI